MSEQQTATTDAVEDAEYLAGFEHQDAPPEVEAAGAQGDELLEAPERGAQEEAQEEVDWKSRAEQAAYEARQWQQKYRSDEGRVAAYQRQAEELKQQLAAMHQQAEARQNGGNTPSQEEVRDAMKSEESWLEFEKEYPEFAEPMKAMLANQRSVIDRRLEEQERKLRQYADQQSGQLGAAVQQLTANEFERFKGNEYQRLGQAHPDWQAVVKSKAFQSWLGSQPPEVQRYADSVRAEHAAYLIGGFKKDWSLYNHLKGQKQTSRLAGASDAPRRRVARGAAADDDYASGFYRDDR